jgi:hypothetical protein
MTTENVAPARLHQTQFRDLAACFCASYSFISRPLQSEGAGKAGCALHPRSRVQIVQKKAHTSRQVQRRQSDFPCAVVLTLIFVLSPAIRPWVVTVACASSRKLDASLEASGPHDFAVHLRRLRQRRPPRPPHPRPALLTLRNAPLSGTGCKSYSAIFVSEKQKYFCERGWTRHNLNTTDLPVGSTPPEHLKVSPAS